MSKHVPRSTHQVSLFHRREIRTSRPQEQDYPSSAHTPRQTECFDLAPCWRDCSEPLDSDRNLPELASSRRRHCRLRDSAEPARLQLSKGCLLLQRTEASSLFLQPSYRPRDRSASLVQ